jgi:hypothetical protein
MVELAEAPYLVEPVKRTLAGMREHVDGVAPAAGADYALTMEGRYVTRLLSVFVRLTTDANAANREVVLEYRTNEAERFALMGAPVQVTANDVVDFVFQTGQGQAEWSVDDSVVVPLLPMFLVPTESIRLHVVNVQAGDTLTLIRLYWERWPTDEAR